MIPRYARKEMTDIWEPATKFKIWYEIEAHACDAQAELGVIPKEMRRRFGKPRMLSLTSRALTKLKRLPNTM